MRYPKAREASPDQYSAAAITEMFTASEFTRRMSMTPRQLYRAIEAGAFHFIEETDGRLFICGNSSANQIRGER